MTKEILSKDNIFINCKSVTSDEAILAAGETLVRTGYVKPEYIQGMLDRDHSLTTYIGNDIAIPHGEFDSKQYVVETGICIMVYPDGIPWSDGNVRIVVGIASNTDDHMSILSEIAIKFSEMSEVEKIVQADIETIFNTFK